LNQKVDKWTTIKIKRMLPVKSIVRDDKGALGFLTGERLVVLPDFFD
jgi:hypothetical protein